MMEDNSNVLCQQKHIVFLAALKMAVMKMSLSFEVLGIVNNDLS